MSSSIQLTPLPNIPLVVPGNNLADLLEASARRANVRLKNGALVLCQKIVSKAEGRLVSLREIKPSAEAIRIATSDDKDPRHVEVVLRESKRIVRHGNRVLISETQHGFICANAGVDLSNAPDEDVAVLLPNNPDRSAASLRVELEKRTGNNIAVIITDTFGRPWRDGLVDVAIGSSGIAPLDDQRGNADLAGRELVVTAAATVDQLAAAAGILMRKDSGIPAVFVSGINPQGDGDVQKILRSPNEDLFR